MLLGTVKTPHANDILLNKLPRHEKGDEAFCRSEENSFSDDLESTRPAVPAHLAQQNEAQLGKSCLSGGKRTVLHKRKPV